MNVEAMSMEEVRSVAMRTMIDMSVMLHDIHPHRPGKPVIGGVFGRSAFAMGSLTALVRNLDETVYYVSDCTCGLVVGAGKTKGQALQAARSMLMNLPSLDYQRAKYELAARMRLIREEADRLDRERQSAAATDMLEASASKVRSIPRRRRQIFEESGGKCHYCGTALTLDGRWHVEHKMPKALGGGNEPTNLVASCAPCNHKKRDRTDVEFKAQLAQNGGA